MSEEFINGQKQIINTSQKIYDAFNDLIFSNDIKVLAKFVAKTELLEMTKDVPGDIVECGVFKGSGIVSWLKIKKILQPNTFKKVIGFDFFETQALLESMNGDDREKMNDLFSSRDFFHKKNFDGYLNDLILDIGFTNSEFELVTGDIRTTSFDFCRERSGFKISILYLDLDIAEPTYLALQAFWDRLSSGGIVVFDEYAYHQWSESQGADRFFEEKGLKIKNLNYKAPTAYVVKP